LSASKAASFLLRISLPIVFILLIGYLLYDTGIVSDDFDGIDRAKKAAIGELLTPKTGFYFFETPLEYYAFFVWYRAFGLFDPICVSVIKIIYIALSFFMIRAFFSLFTDRISSYLISFVFLFFPSHDATVYWFMGQYLTLSIAFYLYAYFLAEKERPLAAFAFGLLGSFISYGSPIVVLGLGALFIISKKFKKAAILIIPNLIYLAYYHWASSISSFTELKISSSFSPAVFARNLAVQAGSFLDACLGPSIWAKIFYSIASIGPGSFCIGAVLTAGLYFMFKGHAPERVNKKLLLGLFFITIGALGVFSMTGKYPEIAFNLGDRITIFGSLLISYALLSLPVGRVARIAVLGILVFSILGISDHWKAFARHERTVMRNIQNNPDLASYDDPRYIYVMGNQYSKLGPFSHIEFLSEGWVTGPLLKMLTGNNKIRAYPLTKNYIFENGIICDRRTVFTRAVSFYIYVYDSEKDRLFAVPEGYIAPLIRSLPEEKRHWIQLTGAEKLETIAKGLLRR